MSICQISNTGGTLVFKAIQWEEDQIFHPSVRPIPNTPYPYMDLSQFMIEVRGINFTVRLTDTEYTTLLAIFAASTKVTLVLYNALEIESWTYTGWLEEPDAKFEYKMEDGQTKVRWWNVAMTVRCDTITGGSFGSLSDTVLSPSYVNLGMGTLDSNGIYLGFITDYERLVTSTVWMPQWMNQVPTIDYSFYTNSLTILTYEAKCNDADKWYLDRLFLLGGKLQLYDIINNINSVVVIKEINERYTSDNWERPWIITLTILVDSIYGNGGAPIPIITIISTTNIISEQITNGTFETGDLTGWIGNHAGVVDSSYPHSGDYCASLSGGNPSSITQTFSTPIPVSDIISCVFWLKGWIYSPNPNYDGLRVYLTFSNGNTIYYVLGGHSTLYPWTKFDITPFAKYYPNSSLTKIEFAFLYGSYGYLDDISLLANVEVETDIGTITINNVPYVMVGGPLSIPLFGNNIISYTPVSGIFSSWIAGGGASVASSTDNPTTLTLTGNGTLQITYI